MHFSRGHRPTFSVLAAVVAVGFAFWWLVYYGTIEAIGTVRSALRDGEEDEFISPTLAVYDLSFRVGDTEIYYGQTLASLITAAIIALAALVLLRRQRRRRPAGTCPHCLSEIPSGAAVCASCTRDVAPATQ